MRFLIQRVNRASVTIEGQQVGAIEKGLLVFLGISQEDTEAIAEKMVKKLLQMRIFEDEEGKTNLSNQDVGGNLLLISQFTLYANCKKGNRPSFISAAKPDLAIPLYEKIIAMCQDEFPNLQTGEFGADMNIDLQNDGPFTIILDSAEIM